MTPEQAARDKARREERAAEDRRIREKLAFDAAHPQHNSHVRRWIGWTNARHLELVSGGYVDTRGD